MTSPSRPNAAVPLAPVAALLVVALALRPQLSAIGPIADGIIADLGVSHAFVGLLTTIPVLCMGLFALVGPSLGGVMGVRGAIAFSVATLAGFAALRALVPGALPMLFLTFAVGVGTGVVGPLLPMFVRGRMPGHGVAGTAAYAAGTIGGAALGSGAIVPLEVALGSWRAALLVLAVGSGVAVVAWLALVRRMPAGSGNPGGARRPSLPRLPLGRPVAWAIGLLFGLQSWLYYGTTAWLPKAYEERGWSAIGAAGLLTLVNVASLGAIVGVPWLSRRGASRRTLLAASASLATVGLAGVTLLPGPAIGWAVLIGLGLGMAFTLVLTLPVDISDDPAETGGTAALMLLVGYLIASAAPFVLGAVRDATGDFEASLMLLVAIAAVIVPFAWWLSPERLRPRSRIATG